MSRSGLLPVNRRHVQNVVFRFRQPTFRLSWWRLEAEQLPCVAAANFEAIWFADGGVIEPVGCLGHVLERIINRIQNVVGSDFHNYVSERMHAEVAASRDVEILPQIMAYRQPCFWPSAQRPG